MHSIPCDANRVLIKLQIRDLVDDVKAPAKGRVSSDECDDLSTGKTDNFAGLEPHFTASVEAEANFDVLVTPEAKMGIKSEAILFQVAHGTDRNCSQPQLDGRSACWLSQQHASLSRKSARFDWY